MSVDVYPTYRQQNWDQQLKGWLQDSFPNRTTRLKHAPALGLYFPEAEGALADGVHDDSAAITNALNAAVLNGSRSRVDLQPGATYALNNRILMPAFGKLVGRATLKMLATATTMGILISNVGGGHVEDVTIDMNKAQTVNGGSTSNQQGIYVSASAASLDTITLRNVKVLNGWQRGISVVASAGMSFSRIIIENCVVTDVNGTAIFVSGKAAADYTTPSDSVDIKVLNNTVIRPGLSGIQLIGVSFARVKGNYIDGGGTGFSAGHGIVFSTTGVSQVTDFVCSGNNVRGFATEGNWGICVSNACTRFVIAKNTIYKCAGGMTVDVEDGARPDVLIPVNAVVDGNTAVGSLFNHGMNANCAQNLSIIGNTFDTNALDGLALANCLNVTVDGNTLTGNGNHGLKFNGANAGTGNYFIGRNAYAGNALGDFAGTTVLPCVFTPAATVYGMKESAGTAPPTTGTWNVMDKMWNSAPASGAPVGWVCTVAGTPGTWAAMANLA